ncbi:MAG: hypothetical protein HZA36_03855 [Parcubacteria group bacterium]|nr:hypothetical protein [Parcubacteria group bacterium]
MHKDSVIGKEVVYIHGANVGRVGYLYTEHFSNTLETSLRVGEKFIHSKDEELEKRRNELKRIEEQWEEFKQKTRDLFNRVQREVSG